jgi:hypothetical protein
MDDQLRNVVSLIQIQDSASSEVLDRNCPMAAHQINLSIFPMAEALPDSRLYASRIEFAVSGANRRNEKGQPQKWWPGQFAGGFQI